MNSKLADLGRAFCKNIEDPTLNYTFESILNAADDDSAAIRVQELDNAARQAFATMVICATALAARKNLDEQAFGLMVDEAMRGYLHLRNVLPQGFEIIANMQASGLISNGDTDIHEPAWFTQLENVKSDGGDVG